MTWFECKVKVKWREIQTEYSKVRYCYVARTKIGCPDFSENLSGKKINFKIGPLAAEITLMQKSTEKHVSGIGLNNNGRWIIPSNFAK